MFYMHSQHEEDKLKRPGSFSQNPKRKGLGFHLSKLGKCTGSVDFLFLFSILNENLHNYN